MDRDGVINEDKGYVYKPEDFNVYSDAIKLIKFSASLKIPIFIVTNQSGIGRGFYSFRDFKNLNQHFLRNFNEFEKSMISISYCPHSPNIGCSCRKPKSYMLRRIIRKNRIKVTKSYMVGPLKCKDYDHTVDITNRWPLIGIGNVNRKVVFGTACQLPDGRWIEKPVGVN